MKRQFTTTVFRAIGFLSMALLITLQVIVLPAAPAAAAGQITARSLTLTAQGGVGGSMYGGIVTHAFNFTIPTGTGVRSIKFEYCTTAADVGALTCVAPPNMDANNVTLLSETGSGITGATLTRINGNSYYVSYASASSAPANTVMKLAFASVKNPTQMQADNVTPIPNYTFFVRVSTYGVANPTIGTPVAIDKGTVTASTAEPIILDGTMPESLVFCTGATVGQTSGVPDCSTATSGLIHFNQLFSPTDTATATSQMAASTNAGSGYVITVNGPTLTSGSNTIAGMATSGPSTHGIAQFGLNLRANTATVASSFPGTSAEITPTSNGTNYKAFPQTGYGAIDNFRFNTGDIVADSSSGAGGSAGTLGGTDAQIYTVSYIANVPGSQPAGNYSTTLTYICTPTY